MSLALYTLPPGQRQLLLDDTLIEQTVNVHRTFHTPTRHPGNPIVRAEHPWEGRLACLYGTVLEDADEGAFKMWYAAVDTKDPGIRWESEAVCYAASDDGMTWRKPNLDVIEYDGSTDNNLVFNRRVHPFFGEMHGVLKDNDDPDPQRRYKMTLCAGDGVAHPGSYFAAFSPDGLRWTPTARPVLTYEGQTPDISHIMRDPASGQYRWYCRIRHREPGIERRDLERAWGRAVGLSESDDFLNWSIPERVFSVDEEDPPGTDAHDMAVFAYEGIYIGLVTIQNCLAHDGDLYLQLTHSRDGRSWQRTPKREPFLPGAQTGEWDRWWTTSANQLVRRGDELWFYYGARTFRAYNEGPDSGPWTGAIGLATMRRDGFCSLDASFDGGQVITIPLHLAGALHINVKSDFGSLKVEALDADGRTVARSKPIVADDCDRTVPLDPVCDLPDAVRLRFTLTNARLYAFWLESDSQ